jgi:hypothetical protein
VAIKPSRSNILKLALLAAVCSSAWLGGSRTATSNGLTRNASDQAVSNCITCHQSIGDETKLYAGSVHAQVGIGCTRCHGGNAAAADKQGAHSSGFSGKLGPAQIFKTCGSCHASELGLFRSSKHFTERTAAAKVDCVQCHGAHGTGSATREFSFAYFCSGCHGLEYLPELNRTLQQMLKADDAQVDAINQLRRTGRSPSVELMALRKDIRRKVAEVVHGTDSNTGRINEILTLDEQLRKLLNSR